MNVYSIMSTAIRPSVIKYLKRPTVAANWSILTLTGLASQMLNMLAIFKIARVLQPQGFGEYNLAITTAAVALVFSALGLRQVLIRECARNESIGRFIFRKAMLLRGIAAIVVGIGTMLYARLIPDPLVTGLQIGILLLFAAQLVWDSIESVLFGLQQMAIPSIINIVGSLSWVCFIWAIPEVFFSSVTVSVWFALLQIGKAITLWLWWLHRDKDSGKTVPRQSVKGVSLFRTGVPFYWLAIMTAVSNSIPVLLLGVRSSQVEIGLFNAPWRVLAPLLLLLNTGMAALYPVLSKQSAEDQLGFDRSVKWAAIIIATLGSCLALCASLIRRELILVLFGASFMRSADVLMYQCWMTLLGGVYYLIGVVLSARDRQRSLAILSTINAAVTIPFVWFGSMYGAAGLALGMLASALVNFPYHWIVFQRTVPTRFSLRRSAMLLLFISALALPAYVIPSEGALILRLGVGALALVLTGIVLLRAKRMIPVSSQARNIVVPDLD